MQDKYVQAIRYKLQKRVRRVNSAEWQHFHAVLKHFLQFVDSTPITEGLCDELLRRTASADIGDTIKRLRSGEALDSEALSQETFSGETEEEAAAIGYVLLSRFAQDSESLSIREVVARRGLRGGMEECFEFARNVYLEPFYEYLDEHIDDQQAILYFLRRYKHRCEWFRADSLRQTVEGDTSQAEKALTLDLYEYLHDQGLDFYIEPRSASGIADFVSDQVGDDKVIADAKVFWPDRSKGKPYLIAAFNQAYTYARDFNESFAYLIIYKICAEDLNFLLPATESLFPCVTMNNKTIFFVVIDIAEQESASKRGALKSIDITDTELVQSV